MKSLSETISPEKILRNALMIIKRRSNGTPTWAAVADICRVGSHHACEICCEIGVDPHVNRYKEMQPTPQPEQPSLAPVKPFFDGGPDGYLPPVPCSNTVAEPPATERRETGIEQ